MQGSGTLRVQMAQLINRPFFRSLILTGWAVLLYVAMEWLFFATMPSFMSAKDPGQKVGVFFLSAFTVLLPLLLITALLAAFNAGLAAAIPALVLSALCLVLLDNFTYTVFRFGIVSSSGLGRLAYGVGFVVIFIALLRGMMRLVSDAASPLLARSAYVLLPLIAISAIAFLSSLRQFHRPEQSISSSAQGRLPDIILVGIDGLNAGHMSAYGYERDTTPNLARLAGEALVAGNAFSNAGKTGGSLTSMLTGKPTTETRVLFPPDILLGEDAYQHLPGILKQHGYRTVQISMQYYGDAYERNLLGGFDVVNGRVAATDPIAGQLTRLGGGAGAYLTGQMVSRLAGRLGHIFFVRSMQDAYAAVTQPEYATHDYERIAEMLRYLDESDSPLFLHVHLMDTHGPEFYVENRNFSNPGEANENWNVDYYDDAIRNSDRYLNDVFSHLAETGRRDSSLVILYSDSAIEWDTRDRVPLMFWFPGHLYAGTVQANVQLLDVAPTILDYLDIPQPSWMSGESILSGDIPANRPIYSALVNDRLLRVTDDRRTWVVDEARIGPPFYQLGKLNLVVCDRWYSLNVVDGALTSGKVAGSTADCGEQDIPTPAQAAAMIVDYLEQQGYDASSLKVTLVGTGPP